MSNTPGSLLARIGQDLYQQPCHPLAVLKHSIAAQLPGFELLSCPDPVVTPFQNFDQLGFPADHPGRRKGDSYYLNADFMLRTHTSAHEVEIFARGKEHWLLAADVYRRDEIDSSHFPVFHQVDILKSSKDINTWALNSCFCSLDGRRKRAPPDSDRSVLAQDERTSLRLSHQNIQIEDLTSVDAGNPYQADHRAEEAKIVTENLKTTINSLIYGLFRNILQIHSSPIKVRWIPAYFPFTSPSYEVEVLFQDKWLEILGCGVVQQRTLIEAKVPEKIGWAFGLGLERIAMVLFSIPDIRLFWSTDRRFRDQFTNQAVLSSPQQTGVVKFQPFSKNPACYKDLSFWIPATSSEDSFEANDLFEIIRDVGGSWVEEVKLIDEFTHPKTGRQSRCYRIVYRSIERNLSNEEVNLTQERVRTALQDKLGIEFR
ncbi:phenylalanyl-tRNA synthetase [Puccinia triticina 1-1 BBBD Race 1]|uniref:phenylalanine--tRNA ligase n=1 Tax=Puccinia triticina (isolate 1-1 / race 1 (BBBD)) TaxID=630390 RepID=A0A180G8B9_PUCT1|nr:phenylalanyl-tRNA synthetase [Puccinia triticina 1-1 BBBD Race 1]